MPEGFKGKMDGENGGRSSDSGPLSLDDLSFTDLYLSENGDCFIRGGDGEGPTGRIPGGAVEDLESLHQRVLSKGQHENEFFLDHGNSRYRAAKIHDLDGNWYALRRAMWPIPNLKQIGVAEMVRRSLGRLGRKSGLIVVAGPTGSGKTTTACSLLQEYLVHFGDVAVAIEDPPELPMNGTHGKHGRCFQIKVEDGDFGRALSSTMRYNPKYIFLGEVRKPYDASQAIRAAINGHLVITTIHAGSIPQAIESFVKLVAGHESPDLAGSVLSSGLAAVIKQSMNKDKAGRYHVSQEVLFLGANDEGTRALVKQGKFSQLSTEIERQRRNIQLKKSPTDL